jgi:hypothetical protein
MDTYKFEIDCNATEAGRLHARSDSVSVRIGQRVCRNGSSEIWDSVIILCQESQLGALSARVIVCHPDWEQQLQVAHIQSRPMEPSPSIASFELDLKPVGV